MLLVWLSSLCLGSLSWLHKIHLIITESSILPYKGENWLWILKGSIHHWQDIHFGIFFSGWVERGGARMCTLSLFLAKRNWSKKSNLLWDSSQFYIYHWWWKKSSDLWCDWPNRYNLILYLTLYVTAGIKTCCHSEFPFPKLLHFATKDFFNVIVYSSFQIFLCFRFVFCFCFFSSKKALLWEIKMESWLHVTFIVFLMGVSHVLERHFSKWRSDFIAKWYHEKGIKCSLAARYADKID